jgi:hypothetical protein
MDEIFVYIVLVVIAIIAAGMFYWAYVVYSNFKDCESTESSYCPSMYCDNTSTLCGNLPFRTNANGDTVCASYLLTLSAPTVGTVSGGGTGG